jgi:4-hydroxymandelate oxidase
MTFKETGIEKMTLEEIKAAAGAKAKPELWEWINGGTETQFTLQRNSAVFEKIMLKLKVFHDLESASTRVKIFGREVDTPVIVAPFAGISRLGSDAEFALAKGAEKAGAMMFLGPVTGQTIGQVAKSVKTPVAWNGEPWKDSRKVVDAIHQAEEAGCCAVGLCVDDFMGIKIKENWLKLPNNAPLNGARIRELRKETSLPFYLKGIMSVEDARIAVEAGVDAIVVSNHGGRVIDCSPSAIEVLPQITEAVGAKIEVLVDGGFRRGTDILKALALGARGVLIGRPVCWGLAAAGAEGVARVLQIMTSELARAMVLTNVPQASKVPGETIVLSSW